MTRPDDKVDRRRALAARAATLAPSVEWLIKGCIDLDAPIPALVSDHDLPEMFKGWAADIQATRKRP